MERAHASRLQAKREADLEGRMRKDRDVRADRDMRDLKTRPMSEEDRSIEAKKEQARLSKHVVRVYGALRVQVHPPWSLFCLASSGVTTADQRTNEAFVIEWSHLSSER